MNTYTNSNYEQLKAEKIAEALHYGVIFLGKNPWPSSLPTIPERIREDLRPYVETLVADLMNGEFSRHYVFVMCATCAHACFCPQRDSEGAFVVELLADLASCAEGRIERSMFLETAAVVWGGGDVHE